MATRKKKAAKKKAAKTPQRFAPSKAEAAATRRAARKNVPGLQRAGNAFAKRVREGTVGRIKKLAPGGLFGDR